MSATIKSFFERQKRGLSGKSKDDDIKKAREQVKYIT